MKDIPKGLEHIDLRRALRQRGMFTKAKQQKALYNASIEVVKAVRSKKVDKPYQQQQTYKCVSNELAEVFLTKRVHIVDVHEAKFKNLIKQFLDQLEHKVNANIGKVKSINKAFEVFDAQEEIKAGIYLLQPLANEVAEASLHMSAALFDLGGIANPSPDMRYKVEESVKKFATSMVETDKAKLTDIIDNAFKQGTSIPDLRKQIASEFSNMKEKQPQLIARTEMLREANYGTLDAYAQTGFINSVQWQTDGSPCIECAEHEGEIQDIGDSFFEDSFGNGEAPPLHPNCECGLVPVTDNGDQLGGVGAAVDPKEDSLGVLYHGEGGGEFESVSSPYTQDALGTKGITYFSDSPSIAAEHGTVTAYVPKIGRKDLINIHSSQEYDEFIKNVLKKYPGEDTSTSIPKYINSIGKKGAYISDDIQAGYGLLNKYIKDFVKFSLPTQMKEMKEYISELEKIAGISDES